MGPFCSTAFLRPPHLLSPPRLTIRYPAKNGAPFQADEPDAFPFSRWAFRVIFPESNSFTNCTARPRTTSSPPMRYFFLRSSRSLPPLTTAASPQADNNSLPRCLASSLLLVMPRKRTLPLPSPLAKSEGPSRRVRITFSSHPFKSRDRWSAVFHFGLVRQTSAQRDPALATRTLSPANLRDRFSSPFPGVTQLRRQTAFLLYQDPGCDLLHPAAGVL